MIDPEFEGNTQYSAIYGKSSLTQPFDITKVASALSDSKDVQLHAKGQVFPSFVTKNFGIGLYSRNSIDAKYECRWHFNENLPFR